MFFDILFMIQHYILYPDHKEPEQDPEILFIADVDEIESHQDFTRSPSNRIIDINVIKTH